MTHTRLHEFYIYLKTQYQVISCYLARISKRLINLKMFSYNFLYYLVIASVTLIKLSESCNELVCASVVTKCMLTQSCNCDLATCHCCKECSSCLSYLYTECCSCVGKF